MKVFVSITMFLYHLQTIKQELWTTLVMYLDYCIDKQLQEGRMRCEMSKFTVLGSPIFLKGHWGGKIDSLKMGISGNFRLHEPVRCTKICTSTSPFASGRLPGSFRFAS